MANDNDIFDDGAFDTELDDLDFDVTDDLLNDLGVGDETTEFDGGFDLDIPSDEQEDSLDIPSDEQDNSLGVNAADYASGTDVDTSELLGDEEEALENESNSGFVNESGSIVIQDMNDDSQNGFELLYLDIDQIAITNRIRSSKSVEGLTQSIMSTGLLRPLTVAPTASDGVYVLLDGYRRIQACAKAGKVKIPCVINNHVSTPEIPIIEAMYNHSQRYSIKEQIEYIKYLEEQKGIMNPTMIEYLLQMNSGDYSKLKDILSDNDDDIVSKLYDGTYDISTAFKKLEQRRKKESSEEKENRRAANVYGDTAESGADQVEGAGEGVDGTSLSEEQIRALTENARDLDEGIEDSDLGEMIESDNSIEGYDPHKQKVGEREYIDPKIKKAVLARDNFTCQCCKRGGEEYIDVLDLHHVVPVYCGGADSVDNSIMLCLSCHHLVHQYATGDLTIKKELIYGEWEGLTDDAKKRYRESEDIFNDEKNKFKRIVRLGSLIRKTAASKGISRDKIKKETSLKDIGRRKPGHTQELKNE